MDRVELSQERRAFSLEESKAAALFDILLELVWGSSLCAFAARLVSELVVELETKLFPGENDASRLILKSINVFVIYHVFRAEIES